MNWPSAFFYLCVIVPWVCGIAASSGFWMTLASALLPPLAWVVLAQHLLGASA